MFDDDSLRKDELIVLCGFNELRLIIEGKHVRLTHQTSMLW